MYSGIKEGASIKAKETMVNRNCGIDSENARGYICKADSSGVSIYLEKGKGRGTIEAIMTPEHFAMNFQVDGLMLTPATFYIRSTHYTKSLPKDFL
ncbi:hypothetical protein [Emticicia sp. 17c]|uniref:hypothetical protein n=1 Tax=Emticicia sp. 17c TaxID=3127704 RepID=UPI00301D82AC